MHTGDHMTNQTSFTHGVLAGMFLVISATTGHWFITPAHVTASTARTVAVAIQGIACLAIAVAIWMRHGRQLRNAR